MRRAILATTLCMAAASAQAVIWGYVDGLGVAHVATTQLDGRYQMVLGRDEQSPRVAGKADGAANVLTRIEISPEARVLRPWLREAARLHGVDEHLLMALIAVESGFDAKVTSPRGAVGLMQILPTSAEPYAGLDPLNRPLADRLRDPRTNILTGARMLADLLRQFGRVDLALAAWNAGGGAVRRAGHMLPPYAETRAHVHFVLEVYWSLLQRAQVRRATHLRLSAD